MSPYTCTMSYRKIMRVTIVAIIMIYFAHKPSGNTNSALAGNYGMMLCSASKRVMRT